MFTDSNSLIPIQIQKTKCKTNFFNYHTSYGTIEIMHLSIFYKNIYLILNEYDKYPESRFIFIGNDTIGYFICSLFTWYGSQDYANIAINIENFKENNSLKQSENLDVYIESFEINNCIKFKFKIKIVLP